MCNLDGRINTGVHEEDLLVAAAENTGIADMDLNPRKLVQFEVNGYKKNVFATYIQALKWLDSMDTQNAKRIINSVIMTILNDRNKVD